MLRVVMEEDQYQNGVVEGDSHVWARGIQSLHRSASSKTQTGTHRRKASASHTTHAQTIHARTEDDVGDEEGHGHGGVGLAVEEEVLHLEVPQQDGEHGEVHLLWMYSG